MRTLVLNSAELRSALEQANRTARLSEGEWKALLGLQMHLQAAWIKQRRSALSAALADSRLPWPVRSLIRADFEGKDFTDAQLQDEITSARKSCAKADEQADLAATKGKREREVIPNSELRTPDVGRDSDAHALDDVARGAGFRDRKAEG